MRGKQGKNPEKKKQKRKTLASMATFSLGKRPMETDAARERRIRKLNERRNRNWKGSKRREESRQRAQDLRIKKWRAKNKAAHAARIQFKFPTYG